MTGKSGLAQKAKERRLIAAKLGKGKATLAADEMIKTLGEG
jgi:hypothetical protein